MENPFDSIQSWMDLLLCVHFQENKGFDPRDHSCVDSKQMESDGEKLELQREFDEDWHTRSM